MHSRQSGFTILELLLVVAIISIVGAIGIFNAHNFLRGEETLGTTTTLQQLLLQGSTSAASRFTPILLVQEQRGSSRFLTLRVQSTSKDIRSERIPNTVTTSLPIGNALTFTPSGRISDASFQALGGTVTVRGEKLTYTLQISLIGESKVASVSK